MTTNLMYTDHALDQMAKRGITRDEVRFILKYGTAEKAPTWKGKTQRWQKKEFIRNHEAKIIYVEEYGRTMIITAMWVYEQEEK